MRKIIFFELLMLAAAGLFTGCSTEQTVDENFGKIKVKPPEKSFMK